MNNRKKNYKNILFLGLITFIFIHSDCFSQSYKFENYSTLHGIVNNYVRNIAKDDDGFVWVATNRGLSRFDGFSFKNYLENGLRSTWISQLMKDKSGKLWVTTEGGIAYYDKINDDFKYISKKDELKVFATAPIFEDSKKKKWVAADNGLFSFDKNHISDTKLKKFTEPHVIYEDHKNRLWIGSIDGLTVFDTKTGASQLFPLNTSSWHYFVYAIYPENEHEIWLGTDAGLLLFDTEKKTFQQLTKPEESQKNLIVSSITDFPEKDQLLWCGTINNGIMVFDRKTRKFTNQYAASLIEPNGLQTNTITTFFEEKDILWLGTDFGLSKVNLNNRQFQTVKVQELYEKKSLDYLTRIIPDVKNPKFWWMATSDEKGGLLYYDSEKKRVINFYQIVPKDEKKNLVNTKIKDLIFDNKGRLWLATFDGIYLMSKGNFKHFPIDQTKHTDAYTLKLDKNEVLWIGTDEGLSELNTHNFQIKNHPLNWNGTTQEKNSDVRSFPIENIDFDDDGNIWIGSIKYGCFKFKPSISKLTRYYIKPNKNVELYVNRVNTVIWDEDNLHFASIGGVVSIDLKTLKCQIFAPEKSFYVYSLIKDKNKNLWACIYNGVCKIDAETKKTSYFNINDGLSNELTLYPINQIEDKYIIGYTGAYSYFNPLLVHSSKKKLKPIVSEVLINKNQQKILDENGVYQPIKIDYSKNNITIKFTALENDNPEKLSFRYKLEDFENNWVIADRNRQVSYTNLDYKKYKFHLQVANSQGEWSDSEANLTIQVFPPFYQTWWFFLGTICSVIFLIYSFYQYRINQLIKLQKMRNRIAEDLHDEIGSTLSSISILSEMLAFQQNKIDNKANPMLQVSNDARDVIDKMDDIIWTINPENDAFYSLETRIKSFAIPLFESKEMDFVIRFSPELESIKIDMSKRRDVYLIMKEAINNLVKYSQCTHATIEGSFIHKAMIIRIIDNGVGFDTKLISNRNGQKNMKNRAEKIGGILSVSSEMNIGTEVKLILEI
jgi:ligand-binding sensor domain-containing protein/two-component sensor histidine kinase